MSPDDRFREALDFAGRQVRALILRDPDFYPMYTHHGRWRHDLPAWTHWCDGFLPGIMWILCARGDDTWREPAERYTQARSRRGKFDREVHDLGFLFISTYGRWYELTHEPALQRRADSGGPHDGAAVPRKGRVPAVVHGGRFAVHRHHDERGDHFLCGPRNGGHASLLDIAMRHCLTTRRVLVRGDGSTAHEGLFDLETGEFLRQTTHQGFRGDSCWSRGLAWSLYGFGSATGTRATRASWKRRKPAPISISPIARPTASRRGISMRLPKAAALVDTSAAAIAASGLLQLADLAADDESYRDAARRILVTLCERYLAAGDPEWEGILKGGVYHLHKGLGVKESVMWGEYFFVEALDKALRHV